KIEKKSPLYFSTKDSKTTNLKVRNVSGVTNSHPIEIIDSFKISNLIYKSNVDVLDNISDLKKSKNINSVIIATDVIDKKVNENLDKEILNINTESSLVDDKKEI